MTKYAVYSLLLLLSIFACNNHAIIDRSVSIDNRVWSYEQQPSFTINIQDSIPMYDIYLKLRHSSNYSYSSIYLLVHEKQKKVRDSTFRTEIKLAQPDGKWIGKSAGSLYEVEYLAKENFTFPDTGKYTFTIEQNMQDNSLKGIVDVGLKIIKR